jgi:hypothetical protein
MNALGASGVYRPDEIARALGIFEIVNVASGGNRYSVNCWS